MTIFVLLKLNAGKSGLRDRDHERLNAVNGLH